MNARIAGIGAWFPEQVRSNDAWPVEFRERALTGDRTFNDIPDAVDEVARITARYLAEEQDPFLGCVERRVAPEGMTAVQAEIEAARRALEDAALKPEDLDVVISYSVVPDRMTPASACAVAEALGAKSVQAWSMDAACATSMAQIAVARALVESGQARNVLITQSHLLLKTFPLLHPAAPGLGDGATAIVVGPCGKWRILETHGHTMGSYYDAVTWIRDARLGEDTPWWQAGVEFRIGSRNHSAAKELQRDTVAIAAKTIRELCHKARVDVECIELLASVEPRGWISRAVAEVMGLSPEIACSIYRERGHLGACGPVANFEAAYRKGFTRGKRFGVLYGQGAGFTRMGVLLESDENSGER